MAKEVIKKDGSREPFDSEKIKGSIIAATQRTILTEERKNQVAAEVVNLTVAFADAKESITTSEIREKILSELDRIEPSVSAAWRAYDEEKKRA